MEQKKTTEKQITLTLSNILNPTPSTQDLPPSNENWKYLNALFSGPNLNNAVFKRRKNYPIEINGEKIRLTLNDFDLYKRGSRLKDSEQSRYEVVFAASKLMGQGNSGLVLKSSYLIKAKNNETTNIQPSSKVIKISYKNEPEINENKYKQELEVAGKLKNKTDYPKNHLITNKNEKQQIQFVQILPEIPGRTLQSYLDDGYIPFLEKLNIAKNLLHEADAFHKLGYIHCDIKPDNIMISETGVPNFIDFGSTVLSNTQTEVLGTPGYIPPEAYKKIEVTANVDVYALGKVLYKMFFEGDIKTGNISPLNGKDLSFEKPMPSGNEQGNNTIDEIKKLIQGMTDAAPESRTSLTDAINKLNGLIDNQIQTDLGQTNSNTNIDTIKTNCGKYIDQIIKIITSSLLSLKEKKTSIENKITHAIKGNLDDDLHTLNKQLTACELEEKQLKTEQTEFEELKKQLETSETFKSFDTDQIKQIIAYFSGNNSAIFTDKEISEIINDYSKREEFTNQLTDNLNSLNNALQQESNTLQLQLEAARTSLYKELNSLAGIIYSLAPVVAKLFFSQQSRLIEENKESIEKTQSNLEHNKNQQDRLAQKGTNTQQSSPPITDNNKVEKLEQTLNKKSEIANMEKGNQYKNDKPKVL